MVRASRKRQGSSTLAPKRQGSSTLAPKVTTLAAAQQRLPTMVRSLVTWFETHQRRLPWRALGHHPYATWLSEIMLQQTQVATVVPYFERWMKLFPTIDSLASASEDQVLSAWQGLGYYSRARNLRKAAQLVVSQHGGKLPANVQLLRTLPGVGRYTAGAIASIAFDQPEPAVDGNVIRVLARLEALRGDPRLKPLAQEIEHLARDWASSGSPALVNQALMELGALICVPEQPRCAECPLARACRAQSQGLVNELPELPRRPKPRARHVVVLLAEHEDRLLLVRQPETAPHWANLFTLPYAEQNPGEQALAAARRLLGQIDSRARLCDTKAATSLVYPITRFRFHATVYRAIGIRPKQLTGIGGRYATAAELKELALPAPHRRLCKSAITLGG